MPPLPPRCLPAPTLCRPFFQGLRSMRKNRRNLFTIIIKWRFVPFARRGVNQTSSPSGIELEFPGSPAFTVG
jgi:hypothetical protein